MIIEFVHLVRTQYFPKNVTFLTPVICMRMFQDAENVSENFAYILNGIS